MQMMTWRIIGHERAVQALRGAASAEAPAHAYLMAGPERIGKRTIARELAAALNCEAEPRQRPCHTCRACRMTDREAHPDLAIVERAEDRRDVRVGDVREARETLSYRPYQGRYKVYVFVDADTMNESSFSSLLLALEEPPPQVVFVVTASQAEAVAPTVQSRCRVVALQAPAAREIALGLQDLYGADAAEAERLAALCGGRVGWAVEALTNPDLVAQRAADVDRAVALSEGRLSERLARAGEATKGESFNEGRQACLRTLDDMRIWWRDMLLVATGSSAPLVHHDRRAELERQAERRGRERIARGLREIESTAGSVERNVTPRLALEALLLRLG